MIGFHTTDILGHNVQKIEIFRFGWHCNQRVRDTSLIVGFDVPLRCAAGEISTGKQTSTMSWTAREPQDASFLLHPERQRTTPSFWDYPAFQHRRPVLWRFVPI